MKIVRTAVCVLSACLLLTAADPLEELKYILGLTIPEAQAVIAYRDANGAYHSLQDLKNVPGVDFKKFEAGKDELEF